MFHAVHEIEDLNHDPNYEYANAENDWFSVGFRIGNRNCVVADEFKLPCQGVHAVTVWRDLALAKDTGFVQSY